MSQSQQFLSLSRAARLVGISRGGLQQKIRTGELTTFEGKISINDLLRIYPKTQLENNAMFEQVENIKAKATPGSREKLALPTPEVLIQRLNVVAHELANAQQNLSHYTDIIKTFIDKLTEVEQTAETQVKTQLQTLREWIEQEMRHKLDEHDKKTEELLTKDTFLRVIAAHVKILPSGHDFFVEGSASILEAALQAGLALNYGCTSGNCGSCKARLVSGEVWKTHNHDYVLSEAEKNMGYILMCSHTAMSDLVLEAGEAHRAEDLPLQNITAKVKKFDQLTDTVAELHLQTPRTNTLRFMAGQWVELSVDNSDISPRCALASCPCDGRNLSFHLHQQGRTESFRQFLAQLTTHQSIKIKGPYGNCVLAEDDTRPALFIAFDEGFAPIKSLVEHAISIDVISAFHLFWFASEAQGHYLNNIGRSWMDALDNFSYTQAFIDADLSSALQTIIQTYPDLSGYNVYIAGKEEFITATKSLLLTHQLPETQFHSQIMKYGCAI